MNRRGFLGAMLAASAAPYIVRANSLMKIVVPRQLSEMLVLWGDGVHNDTAALQSLISGGTVLFQGREYGPFGDGRIILPSGTFSLASHLRGGL